MNKIIVSNYNVWKEFLKNLPPILWLRSRILKSSPMTFNFNLKIGREKSLLTYPIKKISFTYIRSGIGKPPKERASMILGKQRTRMIVFTTHE